MRFIRTKSIHGIFHFSGSPMGYINILLPLVVWKYNYYTNGFIYSGLHSLTVNSFYYNKNTRQLFAHLSSSSVIQCRLDPKNCSNHPSHNHNKKHCRPWQAIAVKIWKQNDDLIFTGRSEKLCEVLYFAFIIREEEKYGEYNKRVKKNQCFWIECTSVVFALYHKLGNSTTG